ncbi:hypothetical protein C0J52_18599 [Blattella germanica]|nr:hypothetical protein C0J52_18599 [Blattella germanica]
MNTLYFKQYLKHVINARSKNTEELTPVETRYIGVYSLAIDRPNLSAVSCCNKCLRLFEGECCRKYTTSSNSSKHILLL